MIDWTHTQQSIQEFVNWFGDTALGAAKVIVTAGVAYLTLYLKKKYEGEKADTFMKNLGKAATIVDLNVRNQQQIAAPDKTNYEKHKDVKEESKPLVEGNIQPLIDGLIVQSVKGLPTEEKRPIPSPPRRNGNGGQS